MIDTSKVDINKAQVLAELQRHVGRENGIHVRDLTAHILNSVLTSAAAERKVRDFIGELRDDGVQVCGHPSSGYYISDSRREVHSTARFLIDRAQSSVNRAARLLGKEPPDLDQLLGLPS